MDGRRLWLLQAVCSDPARAGEAWHHLVAACGSPGAVVDWANRGGERRLLPLLGARAELLGLPQEVRAACAEATAEAWGLNERLLGEVRPAVEALRDAGIEAMALKGMALLGDVYPEHPHRTLGDLDLMVRPQQARAAYAVLTGLGWRDPSVVWGPWPTGRHAVGLYRSIGSSVDLHRRPGPNLPHPGRSEPPAWDGAQPVPASHPLAGTGLLRPLPEQHLVILAAHATRSGNVKAAHLLVDVHHLVLRSPHLDAGVVAEAARAQLVPLRVRDVLAVAQRDLGTPLPFDPAGIRSPSPAAQRAERRAMAADARLATRHPGVIGAGRRFVDAVISLGAGQGPGGHVRAAGATIQAWAGPRLASARRGRGGWR